MENYEEYLEQHLTDSEELIVLPGEEITRGGAYLRGHGTYVCNSGKDEEEDDDDNGVLVEGDDESAKLIASVAGVVLRVNKLISVKPAQSRYAGDVGDIVIGRVVEVGNKQWRVDLAARQHGTLMLGSINLPGGALRRRTVEDQLQMRALFAENDLLVAEVSSFYQHGGMAIHARSMRYGKLENGQLVTVSPSLMKRLNQHFVSLPCGVDAIFGLNGKIWLTVQRNDEDNNEGNNSGSTGDDGMDIDDPNQVEKSRMTEKMEAENKRHAERKIFAQDRVRISRVRNSILALASSNKMIHPQAVMNLYNQSENLGIPPKAMISPDFQAIFETTK